MNALLRFLRQLQNLFTPFGDGDILKICTLLAQVLQMGTAESHKLCLDLVTTRTTQATSIHNYGMSVGNVADLVILDPASVTDAIGAAAVGRATIKNGASMAQSQLERQFFTTARSHSEVLSGTS